MALRTFAFLAAAIFAGLSTLGAAAPSHTFTLVVAQSCAEEVWPDGSTHPCGEGPLEAGEAALKAAAVRDEAGSDPKGTCSLAKQAVDDLQMANSGSYAKDLHEAVRHLALALLVRSDCELQQQLYSAAASDASQAIGTDGSVAFYGWMNLGIARYDLHQTQDAYDALSRAIGLADESTGASTVGYAHYLRAKAAASLGRYEDALTDIQQAIALAPKGDYYFLRGVLYFGLGRYGDAFSDLSAHGTGAYPVLWAYLARLHAHQDGSGQLQLHAAESAAREWPAPVLAFYLKRISEAELLQDAAAAEAADHQSEKCEAAFYLGEYYLLHGKKREGESRLRNAAETCPPTFIEYMGARAELSRLR